MHTTEFRARTGSGAVAVAMRHPIRRPFPHRRADRLGCFGLDQFLDPELSELTNQIGTAALIENGK